MRLGCRCLCTPCCSSTRRRVFVVEATDGGGVAFYATAGVSSKGGVLTPPLARLRTTHQLYPQRIHAEDDTNSRKLIQGKRGLRRYVRTIARSQFRRHGVRCGCCGNCHKRGWMWAAKRLVSPALVIVGRERGCGRRNHMFRWLLKVPVVTKNEFRSREIEIAEGIVVSTPSATHLTGLPHHGSPLQFSYPPISAPFLQNVAHIPR